VLRSSGGRGDFQAHKLKKKLQGLVKTRN
jgi:hypothetical protein